MFRYPKAQIKDQRLAFLRENVLVQVRVLRAKYAQKQITGSNISFISTGL